MVASFPVDIHEPPLIRLCLPSNVGVEKSSYIGCTLKPGKPVMGVSVHCHTFPITSKNPPCSNRFTGQGEAQYSRLMFPGALSHSVTSSNRATLCRRYHSASVGSRKFLPVLALFQLQNAFASR